MFQTYKKILPKDDLIARWVTGLAIMYNDLFEIRKVFTKTFRSRDINKVFQGATPIIKIMNASLREAVKYLQETDNEPIIKAYIDDLPKELQNKYIELKKLFFTGENSDITGRLTRVRNITYHFIKPNFKKSNELELALEQLAKFDVRYDPNEEKFYFAESVSNYILLNSLVDNFENITPEEFDLTLKKMHRSFYLCMEFSKEVVNEFFRNKYCE